MAKSNFVQDIFYHHKDFMGNYYWCLEVWLQDQKKTATGLDCNQKNGNFMVQCVVRSSVYQNPKIIKTSKNWS